MVERHLTPWPEVARRRRERLAKLLESVGLSGLGGEPSPWKLEFEDKAKKEHVWTVDETKY